MMKPSGMSDEFAGAFRTALIEHVNHAARTRVPRRRLVVIGIVAAALLGGGAATATAVSISSQQAEISDYNTCLVAKGWTPSGTSEDGSYQFTFTVEQDEDRMQFSRDSNDCIAQFEDAPEP